VTPASSNDSFQASPDTANGTALSITSEGGSQRDQIDEALLVLTRALSPGQFYKAGGRHHHWVAL